MRRRNGLIRRFVVETSGALGPRSARCFSLRGSADRRARLLREDPSRALPDPPLALLAIRGLLARHDLLHARRLWHRPRRAEAAPRPDAPPRTRDRRVRPRDFQPRSPDVRARARARLPYA